MSTRVVCPQCAKPLAVPEDLLGRKVRCPTCKTEFQAGAPVEPEPANGMVRCTSCQQQLRVRASALGQRVQCPGCGATFVAAAPVVSQEAIQSRPNPTHEPAGISTRLIDPPREADEAADHPRSRRQGHPSKPLRFNVRVKKDPGKVLKGMLKAEVTEEGLRLTQGRKHDVHVPIGSEAEYRGSNRFAVTVDDRRVELMVAQLSMYQNRVAEDVVAYLEGDARMLDPADYKVAWYLYVAPALPLLIPIITLGGALPCGIGFGFAAASFGIVQQQRWPVGLRVVASLGLAVAAYLTMGIIIIALYGTLAVLRH